MLFRTLMKRSPIKAAAAEQRIVVLGSGWGGFQLALNLDKKKTNLTVVSPSNHFVFAPLLPSTAAGTLEFQCIQEPMRHAWCVKEKV